MHLHSVVMHLYLLAVLVHAGDQPLRAGHGEVAGDRRVMRHDIHVGFHADIRGHRLANVLGAAGNLGFAVDVVDSDNGRIGMIHRRSCLGVLRVECPSKPQVAQNQVMEHP